VLDATRNEELMELLRAYYRDNRGFKSDEHKETLMAWNKLLSPAKWRAAYYEAYKDIHGHYPR
jgi:hypothetical protein